MAIFIYIPQKCVLKILEVHIGLAFGIIDQSLKWPRLDPSEDGTGEDDAQLLTSNFKKFRPLRIHSQHFCCFLLNQSSTFLSQEKVVGYDSASAFVKALGTRALSDPENDVGPPVQKERQIQLGFRKLCGQWRNQGWFDEEFFFNA